MNSSIYVIYFDQWIKPGATCGCRGSNRSASVSVDVGYEHEFNPKKKN